MAGASPVSGVGARLAPLLARLWWLHSGFALVFGLGVMVVARAGIAHADKLLLALVSAWALLFVALRFIVGPDNRSHDESLGKRGVRVVANYVIKQFYQQMFFFLAPIYASSATWHWGWGNYWLAPLMLICAVVSTLDLVFDNIIMERRVLAASMFGLAMFGVLNVVIPVLLAWPHHVAMLTAAIVTPAAVAVLTWPFKQVISSNGLLVLVLATVGAGGLGYAGRGCVPPAPLVMTEAAIGHGPLAAYECLPPPKHEIIASQLAGLRCGTYVRQPGGVHDEIYHRWLHNGVERARVRARAAWCDGDGQVFRSELPSLDLAKPVTGKWRCEAVTSGDMVVGGRTIVVRRPRLPWDWFWLPGLWADSLPRLPFVEFRQ